MPDPSSATARAPRANELEIAANIAKIAFQSPELDPWLISYQWIAQNRGLDYLVVAEENGQIVASLLCTPFEAYFGNDIVPLGAVGGVATLPEHRNKGYAGLMMERAVKVLYEKGYCTSALWPFSFLYYRKYGWEICSEYRKYNIPAEFAAGIAESTDVYPAMPNDIPGISALLDRFGQSRSCVTPRTNLWWDCIAATYRLRFDGNTNPQTSRCPWVHKKDGVIDGYCFFITTPGEEHPNLDIREFVAETPEARKALISLLSRTGAPTIGIGAPIDDGFLQELPDPRQISAELHAGFQFRVINPQQALSLRAVDPAAPGTLGFHIDDPVIGPFDFDVEISDGQIRPSNCRASQRLSMDIQTFSQVYSGYITFSRANELGRLRVDGTDTLKFADSLFPKLMPYRSFVELG